MWPGFNVLVREEIVDAENVEILELIGIPNDCMTANMYLKFTSDCLFAQLCIRTWHARQREVWNMCPSVSQQDFILYAILCSVSSRGKFLDYPLIPYWPDAFYVPELIRFLAGVEDFACRSAHFHSYVLNFLLLYTVMPSVRV